MESVPKGAENRTTFAAVYFKILTPTGNTNGPVLTDAMLKTLHSADHRRKGVTFRIDSHKGETCLAVECPPSLKSVVIHELQDSYAGLEVKQAKPPQPNEFSRAFEIRKTPDVFSMRTFEAFTDETNRNEFADPLSGILSAFQTGRSGRITLSMELHVKPANKRKLRRAVRMRRTLASEFRPKFTRGLYLKLAGGTLPGSRLLSTLLAWLITRRAVHAGCAPETDADAVFECRLVMRVSMTANSPEIASKRLDELAGAFARFNSSQCKLIPTRIRPRKLSHHPTTLMSSTEIASLWHPPTKSTDNVVRVSRGNFRELEPPAALHNIDKRDSIVLGRVCFRNDKSLVRISQDSLRRHLIAVGKTGCGKSTFLLNVVRQQMEAGRGVVLIDPHGQLAEEVFAVVPKRRKNDVINFDASNRVAPIGFNPMIGPTGSDPALVADGVLTSFKNVFGLDAGSAPRLLHIFRNCLLSLIGTRHASLHSVQRMLVDAQLRKSVIAEVSNAAVREFWLTEFNRWNERDRTQYIASLQNKLGAFTTNEHLNKILNPTKKGIVLREVMDHSKILICNLSKGTVGHDASKLLGSLLLSSLQIAAMSRADIPESERTDCTVVIDEFHSYLSEGNTTMADALAESRKYRTSYVLSSQMLDGQLDHSTLTAVLGNIGSIFSMTVGPRDAEVMCEMLGNAVTPSDLMKTPKYHGYLQTLVNGLSPTLSIRTLSPART